MAKVVDNEAFQALGDQILEDSDSAINEFMGAMSRIAIMDFMDWALKGNHMEFNIVSGVATLEGVLDAWTKDQTK